MKAWLLITLIIGATSIFAQTTVTGTISDTRQGLQSVTVVLFSLDNALVNGTATDSIGAFLLNRVMPGKYYLSASMIGYSQFFSEIIYVGHDAVTLGEIKLHESSLELGELIVRSQKPLLEQKMDRLVIHMRDQVTSSGNTVLEVLQKCPGVVVNNPANSISMNSRAGVKIMINGKLMQVSGDVAIQMLDGMNASNVEKIELITTPPSSYDAEGSAGIIHIVTSENLEYGTHGSVNIITGYRWAEGLAAAINIQHRSRDLALFADYSIGRNHNLHIFKMSRNINSNNPFEQTRDYSRRENVTIQHNLSAGAEWKPGDRTTMNFLVTAYRRAWEMEANAASTKQKSNDIGTVTTMDLKEVNLWQSITGSVGLTLAPTLKNKIRFNADYLFYHNDNPSDYYVKSINRNFKIDLIKTTPIRMIIGAVDLEQHFSTSLTLEAGIKAVTSGLNNNVYVESDINGQLSVDPTFTSYSTLKEGIAAGYLSTTWKAGQRWQFNGGVRYEFTYTLIETPPEDNLVERKYGNLFPSFTAKKIFAAERDAQISYSRRIMRPTYNDIAPYVFLWSTDAISSGNTSLYPSLADIASVSFHSKQWIASLQHTHSKNEIAIMQPQFDQLSNTLMLASENLEYLNTTSFSNSYLFAIASWWDFQTTAAFQYQRSKTAHLKNNLSLDQFGINVNVLTSLKLPRDFVVEVSGMYQSTSLWGASRLLAFGSLNIGLQKKLGKAGVLRASIDDLLGTNNWKIKTQSSENDLDVFFDYYWNNRFIRLSYNLKFGNAKVKSLKAKSASDEERSRVNN